MDKEVKLKTRKKYTWKQSKTAESKRKTVNKCKKKLLDEWEEYKKELQKNAEISKTYLVYKNEKHES